MPPGVTQTLKIFRTLFKATYRLPPPNPPSRSAIFKVWVRPPRPVHLQESEMSTLRQIDANRRNAQKSTGPTSVTGKAVSSMNAVKTGIHAKSLILPTEKLADLEELIEEYYRHHQPASPEARLLVDDLITCEWPLRRLGVAETQAWKYQEQESWTGPEKYPLGKSATVHFNTFSKLQYRLDATRRAIHRTLQALKQLQAEAEVPGSDPIPPGYPLGQPEPPSLSLSTQTPSPRIGFVPSTPVPEIGRASCRE